jgi:hypothetical protein
LIVFGEGWETACNIKVYILALCRLSRVYSHYLEPIYKLAKPRRLLASWQWFGCSGYSARDQQSLPRVGVKARRI